jgi:hypothetical protein
MTMAEQRLNVAARRRLRDAHGRPIRLNLRSLAIEENLSPRQARRALRRLAEFGLLDAEFRGTAQGEVIISTPTPSASIGSMAA